MERPVVRPRTGLAPGLIRNVVSGFIVLPVMVHRGGTCPLAPLRLGASPAGRAHGTPGAHRRRSPHDAMVYAAAPPAYREARRITRGSGAVQGAAAAESSFSVSSSESESTEASGVAGLPAHRRHSYDALSCTTSRGSWRSALPRTMTVLARLRAPSDRERGRLGSAIAERWQRRGRVQGIRSSGWSSERRGGRRNGFSTASPRAIGARAVSLSVQAKDDPDPHPEIRGGDELGFAADEGRAASLYSVAPGMSAG